MSQEFKSTTSSKKNPFKKKKTFGTNQHQSNTKVSIVKSNKDEEGSEYQKQIQNITLDNINLMESLVKSKAQDESQIENEEEQKDSQIQEKQNLEISQNEEQDDTGQSQNPNAPYNSELQDTVDLTNTGEIDNPRKSVNNNNNNNYSYDVPQWSDIKKPSLVKDRKGSLIYQQDQLLILVLKKIVKEDQKLIEQLKKENANLKEDKNSVQKDVDQLRRQINEIDLERKQLQKDKIIKQN